MSCTLRRLSTGESRWHLSTDLPGTGRSSRIDRQAIGVLYLTIHAFGCYLDWTATCPKGWRA